MWLNLVLRIPRLTASVFVFAIFLVSSLSVCALAEMPQRFRIEVEVLIWSGAERERFFGDSPSEIAVTRLFRDGNLWLHGDYYLSESDGKAYLHHSLCIFRGNGDKAVFLNFRSQKNVVRQDSETLFVTLQDRAVNGNVIELAEFPNNGDACLLPFYFFVQKPVFGGAESWLNQAFPNSTDAIRKTVAEDIELAVEFEPEKVNNQVVFKSCTFVFGPNAFWGGQRLKDRRVGEKEIPIQNCKTEYKVLASGRSSLGGNSPLEWMSTDTLLLADKSTVVNSMKYRLKEYSTYPITQQEFLSSANIPIGHPVAVEGASQLNYVWNGEWAVPESELLATTKFAPVGLIWRTLGWIALIAIPVVVFSWIRLKRGKSRGAR